MPLPASLTAAVVAGSHGQPDPWLARRRMEKGSQHYP